MKSHQFKLIDSTYDVDGAREVLTTLISNKINFIKKHMLSIEERFGSDSSHFEKRIQKLREEKRSLELFLENYEGEEVSLDVSCTASLRVNVPEMA